MSRQGRSDIDGPAGPDTSRREYVRTDDNIPVFYEPYTEGGAAPGAFNWEAAFEEMEPGGNPRLYEMLFDINQKLNILISHLADKTSLDIPEARDVNISGGGLRFVSNTRFERGDTLTLKTFLPTNARVVRLKCEVVRVAEKPSGYEIAVKFMDVDESTRENIIRYVFSRQRKLLRSEKGP